MSLILDALRRADSERERGEIPGLYAQPVPAIAAEDASPRRFGPWLWAALIATVVLAVALLAYLVGRQASPPAPIAAATPSPAREPAAAAPVASVVPPMAPIAERRAAELQEIAEPAKWPTSEKRKTADPAEQTAPAEKVVAAKVESPRSAAAPEPSVLSREQLPDHLRAELPALSVGGSIYSTDAASRSVIINGRVLRENDRLGADLLVEQIKLKAAVLRYKGYRFEIQF